MVTVRAMDPALAQAAGKVMPMAMRRKSPKVMAKVEVVVEIQGQPERQHALEQVSPFPALYLDDLATLGLVVDRILDLDLQAL